MRAMPVLAFFPAFFAVMLTNVGGSIAAGKGFAREPLEKAAKKACITGDFVKGTDILGDLYVETNDPTYVFNQGRCFEQNHQWTSAIDRFLEYLRKIPNMPAAEKSEVETHIKECRAQVDEEAARRPKPSVSPTSVQEPSPTASTASQTPPLVTVAQQQSQPSGSPGSGLRTAGIVVGVMGVGGLAAGVLLALKTHTLSDQLNKPDGYDRDTASTVSTYRTWGWVSYGVGAAALVTGSVLYLVGRSTGTTSEGRPSIMAFVPAVAPGEAVLCFKGAF